MSCRLGLGVLAVLGLGACAVGACVGDSPSTLDPVDSGAPADGSTPDGGADGQASDGGQDGEPPRCASPKAPTTVGLFDPTSGLFDLFGKNVADLPLYSFTFAAAQLKRPVAGHWAPGADTVGWQATGDFFLLNANAATASAVQSVFGVPGDFLPIAGDWNKDGTSSVGYFDPVPSNFYIKDGLDGGQEAFNVGAANIGSRAVAGDWDGDGRTGIGLYVPSTGSFFLKNIPTYGVADLSLGTLHKGTTFWPIAGDWDGCGKVRVGLYDQATGTFYLLRDNVSFAGEDKIIFSANAGKGLLPVAGVWAKP